MADLAIDDPRHGTNNGYSNLGCRCERCKQARRQYDIDHNWGQRRNEWRWRTGRNKPMSVHLAEVEAAHGTDARAKRCSCDECRTARNRARAERRKHPNPKKHGSWVSYSNGCRCDECREAQRIRTQEYRKARG